MHSHLYSYLPILHSCIYTSSTHSLTFHPPITTYHIDPSSLSLHSFIHYLLHLQRCPLTPNPSRHTYIHTLCIHQPPVFHHPSMVSPIHHQFLLPQAALHPPAHTLFFSSSYSLTRLQTLSWRRQRAEQRVTRELSLWGIVFWNLWTMHRAKTTTVSLEFTHLQPSPTIQTCVIDEEMERGCTGLQTVQWEDLNATHVDCLSACLFLWQETLDFSASLSS